MINLWYDNVLSNIIVNNLLSYEDIINSYGIYKRKEFHLDEFNPLQFQVNLPKLLKSLEIDFKINLSASLPYTGIDKDEKNFFPIEIKYFKKSKDIAKILTQNSFFYNWIVRSNAELLMWYPQEGFFTKECNFFDILQEKFPKTNLRYISGNLLTPDWVSKKTNFIYKSFDFFWYDTQKKIKPDLNLDRVEEYEFTLYNRRYKIHRAVPYFSLLQQGKSDKAKHSFAGVNNFTDDKFKEFSMSNFIEDFKKEDEQYSGKGSAEFQQLLHSQEFINWSTNKILNVNFFPASTENIFDINNLHKESFLDVVIETWACNRPKHLFITEKTYRSIACGNIFLIFGNPGTLKYLKQQGIETFDDIFDESYDSEEIKHWFDRWKIIEKNLDIWHSLGKDGRRDYYFKNFKKIEHNYNVFYNRNFKKDVEDLFL